MERYTMFLDWKNQLCENGYTTQSNLQIQWRNQMLYGQAETKRIQHHQTSFTTNAKGNSLGRKHKRRKRPTITNPKQLRKW